MKKQVRVYMVSKKNGGQDTLNKNDHIPNTVDDVYITWGDGKEKAAINRKSFLDNYGWIEGCFWGLK